MYAFGEELVHHADADHVARALDGVYRFVIEPSGALTERQVFDVAIHPGDDGAEVWVIDGEPHAPPRLTLTADYLRWRQLIEGELDVGLALLLRRLRISGELRAVAANLSSTQPLVDSLTAVDTQWLT